MTREIRILDRRYFATGQIIIEKGSVGNRAFLIEKGRVEVFMYDKKGRHVKIAEIGAGSIIGEMALLDKGERSASVRTLEDTILVGVTERDMQESIGDPDGIFAQMMRLLVERLKDTNAKLLQQNMELADIEESAKMTINNIAFQLPRGKQEAFKKEIMPLLGRLRMTMEKYSDL